jgi:hypothetical protein
MLTLNTSLQLVSSYKDSISYLSFETNSTDISLLDIAVYTCFARRLVLDNVAQLLKYGLVALKSVYNDSRIPSSSILGVVESIFTKGNYTIFVRIITSVIEN